MKEYNHKEIEKKWQKKWKEGGVYKTTEQKDKPKCYVLDMFPYPSGEGLHVGHPKGYIATDVYSRFKKMNGFNVLHPMGWDAFGLPAENYAIKNKVHPSLAVKKNIKRFKEQLGKIGFNYDWEREINTTNPEYYKWTQWIFLQMFKKGLAYESNEPINWCPKCKTGLANEDLEGDKCERCGTVVEKKMMRQWVLKITDYADRMLEDLENLNWPESIKESQKNWIGKSEGAEIEFKVKSSKTNDKKNNVIIIHGCPSNAEKEMDHRTRTYDKHWQPWIKNILEEAGVKVELPLMPHPWAPKYEEHKKVFEKLDINENTILIGHSCGASFLVRWLGETGKKVKSLIMVAPWKDENDENPICGEFYTYSVNGNIKLQVENIIVFTSDNEEEIGKDTAKLFKDRLEAKVKELKGHGHFVQRHMGTDKFPELLEEIIQTPKITVFTTRPDTLFGATYCVLAPEHELVDELKGQIENWDEVEKYRDEVAKKTEIERTAEGKEKTGVELKGVKAINPANNEELPIFIADYVLAHYGTGAIMAVPAHDERDFEFAKKFGLEIKQVIIPCADDSKNPPQNGLEEVERETVIVYLKDAETGKYALLNWHGTLEGITTGIMGGIENGQTSEEAVLSEIEEESGITGVTITKKLNWITSARYCASHKNQNRYAIAHTYLAEVKNIKSQVEVSDKEKSLHTLVWVDENEVSDLLTPDHQKFIWKQIQKTTYLDGDGRLVNSGKFDGMDSEEAKKAITEFVGGQMKTTYKLRDWVFSRQRYWGEPIPIIHCEKCGAVPVFEKNLPVILPEVESYEPTGTGESPLAGISEWVNTKCPKCGGAGKRETNTMPQWAGSSWYYLKYIDSKNDEVLVDKEKEKYWSPVDVYVGGAEHATRHLIYARFWHKFLYDIGAVNYKEPFERLQHVGLINAEDGRKMSKRWGNVVNPDDIVETFGADTLRVYEMFMGPFSQSVSWSTDSIVGPRRFLEKVWKMHERINDQELKIKNDDLERLLHKTIKKVSEDIESFNFNTAISQLMILVNNMEKEAEISLVCYSKFLILLSPFAPHIAEELWSMIGNKESIYLSLWPSYDESLVKEEKINFVIQVNGKVRDVVLVNSDISEEDAKKLVLENKKAQKWIEGKDIKKTIFVEGRLVNVIV